MSVYGLRKMATLGMVTLLVAGCQTLKRGNDQSEKVVQKDVFNFAGIPSREYLVGGGYMIRYRASVEGVLYLADEKSERLLATISLQPGESHEMEFDIEDEKLAANLDALGIDPTKANFKLYFVPR
ncbi:MAG: hypothetical protein V3V05_00865 [Pontiella sp.]